MPLKDENKDTHRNHGIRFSETWMLSPLGQWIFNAWVDLL